MIHFLRLILVIPAIFPNILRKRSEDAEDADVRELCGSGHCILSDALF